MSYELVEAFTASMTRTAEDNEDAYVDTGSVVAVFDGRSPDRPLGSLSAPGRKPARVLCEAVTAMSEASDPDIVAGRLHAAVRDFCVGYPGDVAASGVLIDLKSRRVLRLGGVSVGVRGVFSVPVNHFDVAAAHARAAFLGSLLSVGHSVEALQETDQGHEMVVLPLTRKKKAWRNSSYSIFGFACIDGTSTPREMIEVWDLERGDEVVVATDGYPVPEFSLSESEEALKDSLRSDPLRLSPPGVRGVRAGAASYDDRTYVRVRL